MEAVYYNISQVKQKYTQLVSELYGEGQKPSLDNNHKAFLHIGIEENGDIMAFASLFLNNSYTEKLIVGNYQCVDNQMFAYFLFEEIERIAKQHLCKSLLGPMCGDTWHTYRFSVLDKPRFFMEAVHQSYYLQQWKDAGFEVYANYQTNSEEIDQKLKLPDFEEYFVAKGIAVRNFNMAKSESELKLLHGFCMELFKNNVLFSPISEQDFIAMYQPVLAYLNPELIYFFMDGDDLVGLLFAVENHFNPKQVIVKTIARNPAEKYKGLATMYSAKFLFDLKSMNYETMLHAYFHLNNNSKDISTKYGGKRYQQHLLLQKRVA